MIRVSWLGWRNAGFSIADSDIMFFVTLGSFFSTSSIRLRPVKQTTISRWCFESWLRVLFLFSSYPSLFLLFSVCFLVRAIWVQTNYRRGRFSACSKHQLLRKTRDAFGSTVSHLQSGFRLLLHVLLSFPTHPHFSSLSPLLHTSVAATAAAAACL